jgi:hypothetical protein
MSIQYQLETRGSAPEGFALKNPGRGKFAERALYQSTGLLVSRRLKRKVGLYTLRKNLGSMVKGQDLGK